LGIVQLFGVPVVVAINIFEKDHDDEVQEVLRLCESMGIPVAISDHHARGGEGAIEVAKKVKEVMFWLHRLLQYPLLDGIPIKEKIESICTKVYGASKVQFSVDAQKKLDLYTSNGYGDLPICMAKTQYSLSDDPKLLGAPTKFKMTISDVRLSAGAGFVVALTGSITTMPGLPKVPASVNMDLDPDGKVRGCSEKPSSVQ